MQIPRMSIPVFVSSPHPRNLSPGQVDVAESILDHLTKYNLQWRALGTSDYPQVLPVREVLRMIRHCSGGVILGFEQLQVTQGTLKRGSDSESKLIDPISLPTPWNQLEAGMLFSAGLPLLIFREETVKGGVFDVGVADVFTHEMPTPSMSEEDWRDLDTTFQRWSGLVRNHYYSE